MEETLEYIFECLSFCLVIVVFTTLMGYGLLKLDEYDTNRRNKKECYEIYATDNVILKKCQKYFKEE